MPNLMLNRIKARLSGAPAPRSTLDVPVPFPRPNSPRVDVPDSQWDVLDAKLIEIAELPGIEIGMLFRIADTITWTATGGWTVDGIPVVTWARNAPTRKADRMNRPMFLQPGDTPPAPTRGVLVEGTTVEAPAAGGSQWRARTTYVDVAGQRHPLTVYGPDRETAQSRLTTRIAELDTEN